MHKKILIITYEFPPDIGGAGIVAKDIAHKLAHDGFDVSVLTHYNKMRTENFHFHFYQIRIPPKFYPFFYFLKIVRLGLDQFDKIILNDLGGTLTAGFFFPTRIQNKCIVYLHGDEPKDFFRERSLLNKIFSFTNKYLQLLDNCQNIIAVSNFIRDKFVDYSGLSNIRGKIKTIYNGINTSLFFPMHIDLHALHSIGKEFMILLSISRVVIGKGYENMYDIFKKLINNKLAYHWIIIGDGPLIPAFQKKIESDNFMSYITIIKSIDRDDLKKYYSSADVFWQLSNFEESLGLVYLEAASCGTPSIGRKAFGVKEAIEDGISGFLVKDDDECYKVLEEKKFKEINRNDVCRFSERFNINNTIKSLIDIL